MLVQPGFALGLLEPFTRDPSVGQTQAKLGFLHDPTRLNDAGGFRIRFWLGSTTPVGIGEIDTGQYDVQRDCIACGGAIMIRTDVFQRPRGFDPIFSPFGPEDLDFSLRVRKFGYRAVYCPAAVALHAVSGTFEGGKQSSRYAEKRIAHWLLILRRHGSPIQRLAFQLGGAPFRPDAGYWSDDNAALTETYETELIIATAKDWKQRKAARAASPPRGRIRKDATRRERMERKLLTKAGREPYKQRGATVEPVFGQMHGRGLNDFLLRGLKKASGEWSLFCTTHNLLKARRAGWRSSGSTLTAAGA